MKKINIIIKEEDNKNNRRLKAVQQSSLTLNPEDRPKKEPEKFPTSGIPVTTNLRGKTDIESITARDFQLFMSNRTTGGVKNFILRNRMFDGDERDLENLEVIVNERINEALDEGVPNVDIYLIQEIYPSSNLSAAA